MRLGHPAAGRRAARRHPALGLAAGRDGPEAAIPLSMPMEGRELRLVGVEDPNDPAGTGPPELDAWVRYDPVQPTGTG